MLNFNSPFINPPAAQNSHSNCSLCPLLLSPHLLSLSKISSFTHQREESHKNNYNTIIIIIKGKQRTKWTQSSFLSPSSSHYFISLTNSLTSTLSLSSNPKKKKNSSIAMSLEDSLRSLSLDYLNLLINGQAFSDVTFSVEGRLVHAHRCILAARSLFFRKFFCGPDPPPGLDPTGSRVISAANSRPGVIPVNSVGYEVFLLLLQFLYSGQVSIVPQKHEPRPNCGERGCWHTHCTSAVDLALDTLAASRYFGVEQLALLTQVFCSQIILWRVA